MRTDSRAPSPSRRFLSVGTKLTATTIVVLLVATAAVFVGLSRFEREKMLRAKEQAARAVTELFLRAVSTPVVFDDATGMRDSVALLGLDPEVLGVELWRVTGPQQTGERLAVQLRHAQEASLGPRWVDSVVVQRRADRIILRDAVRDSENKVIAVAAIQYSLANENAAYVELRHQILTAAAGVAAVLALILWGVSRRWIVGPLGRLLAAVRQVENGDRVELGATGSDDEVGRLANAFARMADAVVRREQDIARRNADMKLVLDNVGQGFLVFDAAGQVAAGHSAIVERWFGPLTASLSIVDYLRPIERAVADMLSIGLEAIRDGFMPLEVSLDQLPRRLHYRARHYACAYHPIVDGEALRQLVLVISDITVEVERERSEEAQRDLIAGVSRMMADKSGFTDFLQEAGTLVQRIVGADASTLHVEHLRDIHTLKGVCAIFGLNSIAALCHRLEDRSLEEGAVASAEARGELNVRWAALNRDLAVFSGTERNNIEISPTEYAAFARALHSRLPYPALLASVWSWSDDPVLPRLQRLGEHAQMLARRLGKCAIRVDFRQTQLRLPHEPWNQLWASLVHAVRNAVDHGLESEAERVASGKSPTAVLTIAAAESGDELTFVVGDDGRGIDWQDVRSKAARRGLPCGTQDELVEMLFADGFSTRDVATDTSGRGVGLAALRAAVTALGGHMTVHSTLGEGTSLVLRFGMAHQAGGQWGQAMRSQGAPPRLALKSPAV